MPPNEWAERFDAVDWGQLDARLHPPHHPRLEGPQVWVRGVEDVNTLPELLDLIADEVERVDQEYEAALEERERAKSEGKAQQERRQAQEHAAFGEWARNRPPRTD